MKTKTSTQQAKAPSNGTGKSATPKNGVKANGAKTNGAAKTKSERQKNKEQLAEANAHLIRALERSYWSKNGSNEDKR